MRNLIGTPARPGLGFALLLVLTLTGCAGENTSSESSASRTSGDLTTTQPPSDSGRLVEIVRTGAMCPGGPCRQQLAISANGHWHSADQSGAKDSGTLDGAELARLTRAVRTADLAALQSAPSPTSCAADVDGGEMIYIITSGAQQIRLSSCRQQLPPDDRLIQELWSVFTKHA
jgi:hypothetical protein